MQFERLRGRGQPIASEAPGLAFSSDAAKAAERSAADRGASIAGDRAALRARIQDVGAQHRGAA